MSRQSKARRLADALSGVLYCPDDTVQAAAELLRLSDVEDEWMALSQDQGKAQRQIDRLTAQRDALLAENAKLKARLEARTADLYAPFRAEVRAKGQRCTPFRLGIAVGRAGAALPNPYVDSSPSAACYRKGVEYAAIKAVEGQ